ncbi:MAG: phosphodiesterase [Minwuia sp.]|uniref:phosphodiesterase n=1 Tax=Minwuia sp. TaxID=2493630 RepID=UPI003A8A9201
MKFVAVSDTHIVPKGQPSRGLDTAERLRLALADLAENHSDAEFCVMCGDLADHGDPAAYDHFAEIIDGFPIPLKIMIGNHDHRENFRTAFPRMPVDGNGFVQSVHVSEHGHFIFCDSYEAGRVDGRMCERRLAWLDDRLTDAGRAGVGACVFFHHPPYRTGGRIDALRLTDHAAVGEVLSAHDHVRHIFAGHTHRIASGTWRGIPFATFGATHYNNGLPLVGPAGHLRRFVSPAYSTVVLVDDEQIVVHANEFLNDNPEVDAAHFDHEKIDALIAAGGDISAIRDTAAG